MRILMFCLTTTALTLGCSQNSGPDNRSTSVPVPKADAPVVEPGTLQAKNVGSESERPSGMVLIPAGKFHMGGDAGEM